MAIRKASQRMWYMGTGMLKPKKKKVSMNAYHVGRKAPKRKARKAKRAKGQVPVKVLNKRLVRLNSLLVHRKGGKAYSGRPS